MNEFKPLDKASRIESWRLSLRPVTNEDLEKVLSWRNAEFVRKNFFYRTTITMEEELDYFNEKIMKGKVFQFVVSVKETGDEIGCVYLQHYDEKENSMESGVFFAENASAGKGYGTEAVRLMNDWAFETLKLSKTYARVIDTNKASLNLHIKAGFKEISRSSDRVIPTGDEVTAVTFERVNM